MLQRCRRGLALGVCGMFVLQAGCLGPSAAVGPAATASVPAAPAKAEELPKDKAVQACLAVAQQLDQANKGDAAIEQYEKVLQLSPGCSEASRRLAVLYDRRPDFTKAEAEYLKVAKARPRDADLYCDWGYSYYLRNNWLEAENKLRKALDLNPKHARARCNLGLVFGQQGRFKEATQAFLDAGLDKGDAHCNLAFVYWTRGRLDDARREAELARKLNPSCTKALELIAQLDQAGKPRPEAVAAKSGRPDRRERQPVPARATADARPLPPPESGYRLPPGWAAKPPSVPPAAPQARGEAVMGTVTYDETPE